MFVRSLFLFTTKFRLECRLLLFSLFFSLFSLYIPYLELTISFRSLLFLISGFICGPLFGLYNAAFCDFFSVFIKGYCFSPVFFIQSIFFGFIGGMWGIFFRKTKNFSKKVNNFMLFSCVFLFFVASLFLSFFNFLLLIPISIFAIFLCIIYFSFRKRLEKKFFSLFCNLISLLLISSCIGSFLIGSFGVLIFNSEISILLSLTFRVLKEIFKISISIIPLFFVLKRHV